MGELLQKPVHNNPSQPVNFSAFCGASGAQPFVFERESSRFSEIDPVDADRQSLIAANIKDLNPFPDYRPDNLQSPNRRLAFDFRGENFTLDQSLANENLYKIPKLLGCGFASQEIQLFRTSKAAGLG